jgi:hypothetical protein
MHRPTWLLVVGVCAVAVPPPVAGAQSREHLGLAPPAGATFPAIRVNDNRVAAGRFVNGVLTVRLEVRAGT